GTHNIRKVFRVWTSLNGKQPDIAAVPSVTILKFKKCDDGLLYIEKQEDNWTLEGLIKSVPLVNWWYDCVVRVVVGDLVARAGSFLATANQATSNLADKANQIRDNSSSAIAQGQTTAKEYFSPTINKVQDILNDGLSKSQDVVDHAKNAIWNAQKGVKDQISKVTGGLPYSNGNIQPSTPEMTAH
ncbi:13833_t:CDS:2, partial [Dentiscutata heterogama]